MSALSTRWEQKFINMFLKSVSYYFNNPKSELSYHKNDVLIQQIVNYKISPSKGLHIHSVKTCEASCLFSPSSSQCTIVWHIWSVVALAASSISKCTASLDIKYTQVGKVPLLPTLRGQDARWCEWESLLLLEEFMPLLTDAGSIPDVEDESR